MLDEYGNTLDPSDPTFDPDSWDFAPYIERLDFAEGIQRTRKLLKLAGRDNPFRPISTPRIFCRYNWHPFTADARKVLREDGFAFTPTEALEVDPDEADWNEGCLPANVPATMTVHIPVNELDNRDVKRTGQAVERALRRAIEHRPTAREAPNMLEAFRDSTPGIRLAELVPGAKEPGATIRIECNWSPFATDQKGVRTVYGDWALVTVHIAVTTLAMGKASRIIRDFQKAFAIVLKNRPTSAEIKSLHDWIPADRRFLFHGADGKREAFRRDVERWELYCRYLLRFREIAYLENRRSEGKPVSVYDLPLRIGERQPTEDGVREVIGRLHSATHGHALVTRGFDRSMLEYRCDEHGRACPGNILHRDATHTFRSECQFLNHWYRRARRLLHGSSPTGEVLQPTDVLDIAWGTLDAREACPVRRVGVPGVSGLRRERRAAPSLFSASSCEREDWNEIHSARTETKWALQAENRRLAALKKTNPSKWADLVAGQMSYVRESRLTAPQ